MDYKQGLAQLREALQQSDQRTRLDFATLEARLDTILKDTQQYGLSDNLRHEQARVIDALNNLAFEYLGMDFVALCLSIAPSLPQQHVTQESLTWCGGSIIAVGTKDYLLCDPIEETYPPDRSFVLHQTKALELGSNTYVWLKQVSIQHAIPSAIQAKNALDNEGRLLRKLEDNSGFPRLLELESGEFCVTLVHTFIQGTSFASAFGPLGKPVDGQRAYQLLRSMNSVCTILGTLHHEGYAHRFLTPEEIILAGDRQGSTVLRSIGLATWSRKAGEGPDRYRAPEQKQDSNVIPDLQVDVYQIGAILYHLLTGRLPTSFLFDIEPPSTWNSILPSSLDTVILRALAENPDDRWQNIGNFNCALQQAASQLESNLRGDS